MFRLLLHINGLSHRVVRLFNKRSETKTIDTPLISPELRQVTGVASNSMKNNLQKFKNTTKMFICPPRGRTPIRFVQTSLKTYELVSFRAKQCLIKHT